jgi:hypothetical protein
MNKSIFFSNKALFVYILLLLLLQLFVHHVDWSFVVGNNGGKVIVTAQQLLNPDKIESLSFYHSRFVYPLLVGLSFEIGGLNLESVYWLTQAIYIFSISSLFWFAESLFGKRVAFFSALLICVTPNFFILARGIYPDYLLCFFIISSILMFQIGWKHNKPLYWFFSGILISLACFTRETSWLYVAYPIIFFFIIPNANTSIKNFLLNSLSYFSAVIIVTLVSSLYLFYLDESLWELIGALQPGGLGRVTVGQSSGSFFLEYISKGPIGLALYPSNKIPLFPLMMISWIVILWKSFKHKSTPDALLLAAMLPSLPFALLLGVNYPFINERHILLFTLTSHLAFFRTIQLLYQSEYLKESTLKYSVRFKKQLFNKKIIIPTTILIIILSYISIFQASFVQIFLNKVNNKVRIGLDIEHGGRFSSEIQDIAEWIKKEVPKGETLCVGGYFDHAISFLTELDYIYKETDCIPKTILLEDYLNNLELSSEEFIAIGTSKKFQSSAAQYRRLIYVTTQKDITNFLNTIERDPQWILVFKSRNPHFKFQSRIVSLGSELLFENQNVIIFKSISSKSLDERAPIKRQLTGRSEEDFVWLSQNYPEEYLKYKKYLLKKGFDI